MRFRLPLLRARYIPPARAPILRYGVAVLSITLALIPALMLSDEESRLGITHAGFAMTSLPHKAIQSRLWMREGHKTTLLIESGSNRKGEAIGVPYGSIARLMHRSTSTNLPRFLGRLTTTRRGEGRGCSPHQGARDAL